MSEERRKASVPGAEGSEELKVVDKRRFRPDGGPVEPGRDEGRPEEQAQGAPTSGEAGAAAADPREAQLAAQSIRIDELSRAYSALLEDNKAFRARLEREKARVVEAERASVAQALLEATDDLERALAAVHGAGEAQGDALRNLLEGVRLSLAALHKRIGELGAHRIPVAGQRFDPHVAEAIDTVAVADEAQDGVVIQEIRPGYRIGDRILRPARVRVGRVARA
jgi:molecular chaperone GrpE